MTTLNTAIRRADERRKKIVDLYVNGMTQTEISAHMEISHRLVALRLGQAGIRLVDGGARLRMQNRYKQTVAFSKAGMTNREIAKRLGLSELYIRQFLLAARAAGQV